MRTVWISTCLASLSITLTLGNRVFAQTSQSCELFNSPGINTRSVSIQPTMTRPNTEIEAAILNISSLGSEIRRLSNSFDFEYSYNLHDLNNDGQADALVQIQSQALCGTRGCPQIILIDRGGRYEPVATEAGTHVLGFGQIIVTENSQDWDILTFSAYDRSRHVVRYLIKNYDGQRYTGRREVSAGTSLSGTAYLVCGTSHSLRP